MLFTIGSLLIFVALYLTLYSRFDLVRERVFSEVELLIENNGINECNCDDVCINDENNDSNLEIDTDYIENENNESENKTNANVNKKNYIGYLKIPKISLNYGFVAKDSYYNNVNRNIEIIEPSDFPDVNGGNFIIAGHSGNASISYFKNLYLLKIGDVASITYKNKVYTYKITNIYKDDRDGKVSIIRNEDVTTLTLITCSYKDKKNHTIYIAELQKVL